MDSTPRIHIQITTPSEAECSIDHYIQSPQLRNNLRQISLIIAQRTDHENLHFYTDGSYDPLKLSRNGSAIMGAAWVLLPTSSITDPLEFKCATTNWPSSTRAELLAIMTSLIATPRNSHIVIHSDSQAAIDGINKIMPRIPSCRQWLKLNNHSILSCIRELITDKKISLTLRKVKAHSGNEWNDRADALAKEAADTARTDPSIVIPMDHTCDASIQLAPQWYNHVIDWPL